MNKFGATIQLPPPSASDVVSRIIHTDIDGTETEETVEASVTQHEVIIEVEDDAIDTPVHVCLKDVDNAGNVSEKSDPLEFTVRDTTAPPKPGELGLVSIREITEESDSES